MSHQTTVGRNRFAIVLCQPCSPDVLTEQELRDYFTYLVKKKRIAQSTLKTYIFAIEFLYTKTLQKPWPTLKLLRARTREKLRWS
jgi:hypothetical protein